MTQSITGPRRQATENEDGRRVVRPFRLAADQSLGPECECPAQDLGIDRPLNGHILGVEQEPIAYRLANECGSGRGNDPLNGRRFFLERAGSTNWGGPAPRSTRAVATCAREAALAPQRDRRDRRPSFHAPRLAEPAGPGGIEPLPEPRHEIIRRSGTVPPGQERQQQGVISVGQSPGTRIAREGRHGWVSSAFSLGRRASVASQSGPPVLQHSSDDAAQFGLGLVGHVDNVLDLHRMQGVGQAHVRDDRKPEYFHAGVDRDQDLGNG